MNTVTVPDNVMTAIKEARDTGLTNMFDCSQVQDVMRLLGRETEAQWVESNKAEYTRIIMYGR